MEDKDWEQRSMMTATSKGKLQFAFHTFENCVGPGQYEQGSLTNGQNIPDSKKVNMPKFSIGHRRNTIGVNPENKHAVASPHKTPAGAEYDIPHDSPYFNKHRVSTKYNEIKFFSPKNMNSIKA
jgi:hypothetical protein